MTRTYDAIRAIKRELQEIASELKGHEERRLYKLTELVVDLCRECETLAHHLSNVQDKVRLPVISIEDDPDETPTHPTRVK